MSDNPFEQSIREYGEKNSFDPDSTKLNRIKERTAKFSDYVTPECDYRCIKNIIQLQDKYIDSPTDFFNYLPDNLYEGRNLDKPTTKLKELLKDDQFDVHFKTILEKKKRR